MAIKRKGDFDITLSNQDPGRIIAYQGVKRPTKGESVSVSPANK